MNDNSVNCKQDMKNEEDTVDWGDLNSPNLSEEQVQKLRVMLQNHVQPFVSSVRRIGYCDLTPLEIKLKDPNMLPLRQKQYRLNPNVIEQAQDQINQFIEDKIISPCDSQWNSPVLLVPKGEKKSHRHMSDKNAKPKKYRLITDLRGLNKVMHSKI